MSIIVVEPSHVPDKTKEAETVKRICGLEFLLDYPDKWEMEPGPGSSCGRQRGYYCRCIAAGACARPRVSSS